MNVHWSQFTNLSGDRDLNIYRILSIDRLIDLFENKHTSFSNPRKWLDGWENALLKSTGILEDGTTVSFDELREKFYLQCWSTHKETDALWQSFSKNGMAAKI